VEKEWGFGRFDARGHCLFPLLSQHLKNSRCWEELKAVENGFQVYVVASQSAYGVVLSEVTRRMPELEHQDSRAMAQSLVLDAYYRVTGSANGLGVSYEPKKTVEAGETRFHLQLGAWDVGSVVDPAELQPLADLHRLLVNSLPSCEELTAVDAAYQSLRQTIEGFQRSLSPDDFLLQMVLAGRCDMCPS